MRIVNTIILLFCITILQAQKTDLALHLEEGATYKQVTQATIITDQEIEGQKMNIRMVMSGTISFFVKEATPSAYTMDATYDELKMSLQLPQGGMFFDSESNDENDLFSKMFATMIGKPFKVVMNSVGEVVNVKEVENLWNDTIDHFYEIPQAQREQLKAQLLKSYGEKALKGNIEMVTAIYPDHSVNKGDTWTVNTRLESGMAAKVKTNYEFVEITNEYALIKGTSTIQTEDKNAYIQTNEMDVKYDLTGTMTSTIKVDKNTGWIIDSTINQEITGDIYIKENPKIPNGMEFPIRMQNNMIITNH